MRNHVAQVKDLIGEFAGRWRVDLELREDELRALGSVAAQWGFLENLLLELAKHLARALGEDHLSKEFDSDSFRSRSRALRELVDRAMANDPDRDRLIALLNRASSLQGERQRLIHGVIEWDEADRDTLNVQTHKNPNGAAWNVNAADIEAVANKIAEVNCLIVNFPSESPWPNIVGGAGRDPGAPVVIDDSRIIKKVGADKMTWGTVEGLDAVTQGDDPEEKL